jgi:hypothetical protein
MFKVLAAAYLSLALFGFAGHAIAAGNPPPLPQSDQDEEDDAILTKERIDNPCSAYGEDFLYLPGREACLRPPGFSRRPQ